MLVCSLFHGLDLFGRAFEAEGFFVVRAAEKILGFDARDCHLPKGKFEGIIGGTPCQAFSQANRKKTHRDNPAEQNFRRITCDCEGCQMLKEFCRLVTEAQPDWFCLENVPQVPNITIEGYTIQRFNLNASECGSRQNRLRCFQFGSKDGLPLIVRRQPKIKNVERCVLATEFSKTDRREFADICELQGLPRDFELSNFSQGQKYKLVGNGVNIKMGRLIAKAIRDRATANVGRRVTLCECECGQEIEPDSNRKTFNASCRQRIKRLRDLSAKFSPGAVTVSA